MHQFPHHPLNRRDLPDGGLQIFERLICAGMYPSAVAFSRVEPGVGTVEIGVPWQAALAYIRLNAHERPRITQIIWVSANPDSRYACEGSTPGFWSRNAHGLYTITAGLDGSDPVLREVSVSSMALPQQAAA